MSRAFSEILPYFPLNIQDFFIQFKESEAISEIRMRCGRKIMLYKNRENMPQKTESIEYLSSAKDILHTLQNMCENSIYAFNEEIKNGFITLKGGHRVGMAGSAVIENGQVKSIKDLSGINIRVLKEVKGCSEKIYRYLFGESGELLNTLIISPPGAGKTTMLRDLARNISNGNGDRQGLKVSIVDERGEIAACQGGLPLNDIGIQTDVLSFCPKNIGMLMLLRAMSPDVIITDEIGAGEDGKSIKDISNAGVKIIASAHGYGASLNQTRVEIADLIKNNVFERIIVLSSQNGPGTLKEVIDMQKSERLYSQ